jgi:DNA-directed RNA polymerase sigma subunit (sigma70/sigma32)
LQEIGDHFKVSRERARQIEKGVSDKVSKYLIGSEDKTVPRDRESQAGASR